MGYGHDSSRYDRRIVLAVSLFGTSGTLAELTAAHYEGVTQQVPLARLIMGLIVVLVDLIAPRVGPAP